MPPSFAILAVAALTYLVTIAVGQLRRRRHVERPGTDPANPQRPRRIAALASSAALDEG
ncbi:hypothetical protein [Rugosimonospora africana]|nr:hypothetical protein [Rugosimonospora africana]